MNPPEIPEGSSDLRPRGAAPHGRSERDRPGIADVRVEFDFSDPREVGRGSAFAAVSPSLRLAVVSATARARLLCRSRFPA